MIITSIILIGKIGFHMRIFYHTIVFNCNYFLLIYLNYVIFNINIVCEYLYVIMNFISYLQN